MMFRLARIVILLTLLAIPASTAQAQEPAPRVYVAYYQISFGDLEEWIGSHYQYSVPILDELVAEGALTGHGARMHNTGGEYNIRQVLRGDTDTDFEAVWDQYLGRFASRHPEASERGNRMILAHEDEIWNIDEVNVDQGSVGKYMYDAQFLVNFADLEEWISTWNSVFGPALEQARADGLLTGWVTESHNTGGKFNWKVLMLTDDWDSLDDVTARVFEAAPLSHPIWKLFTAHKDELWETLPPPSAN
jgi:hypothetical protein